MGKTVEARRTIELAALDGAMGDTAFKRVMAQKPILIPVLREVIPEYADLSERQLAEFLEGEPRIGLDPVGEDEGALRRLMQKKGEAETLLEGAAYFDVRVEARLPDGSGATVEIDLEGQNKWNLPYSLLTRGVFYGARLISMQGDVVLPHSRYDLLRKCYSIWVVRNAPRRLSGHVARFELALAGEAGGLSFARDDYDKLCVAFFFLDKERASPSNGALGLLSRIFCVDETPAEKVRGLVDDFGIMLTNDEEREVSAMCNFSEGFFEEGLEQGLEQGRRESVRALMASMGLTLDQALDALAIPDADRQPIRDALGTPDATAEPAAPDESTA